MTRRNCQNGPFFNGIRKMFARGEIIRLERTVETLRLSNIELFTKAPMTTLSLPRTLSQQLATLDPARAPRSTASLGCSTSLIMFNDVNKVALNCLMLICSQLIISNTLTLNTLSYDLFHELMRWWFNCQVMSTQCTEILSLFSYPNLYSSFQMPKRKKTSWNKYSRLLLLMLPIAC